jgi:hypothetical protein
VDYAGQKCFVPTVKGQQATTFYYNAILEWNKLPVALKLGKIIIFLNQVSNPDTRLTCAGVYFWLYISFSQYIGI